MPIIIKRGSGTRSDLLGSTNMPDTGPDRTGDRTPNTNHQIPPYDAEAIANGRTKGGTDDRKQSDSLRPATSAGAPPSEEAPRKVGDKSPPIEHQFKKGASGNPSGRPRRSTSFMADLAEVLREVVYIQENGRTKAVSKQKGMIKRFAGKGLNGDDRAFGRLIPFMVALDRPDQAGAGVDVLTPAERKILKQNARQILEDLLKEEGHD